MTTGVKKDDGLWPTFDDMAFCVEMWGAAAVVDVGAENADGCGSTSDSVELRVESLGIMLDDVDDVTPTTVEDDNCVVVISEDAAPQLICREAAFDVVTFCDCCVVPAVDGTTLEVNCRVETLEDVAKGARFRLPYTVPTSVTGVLEEAVTGRNALLAPFTAAGTSRL